MMKYFLLDLSVGIQATNQASADKIAEPFIADFKKTLTEVTKVSVLDGTSDGVYELRIGEPYLDEDEL